MGGRLIATEQPVSQVIAISPSSLPNATVSVAYNQTLTASGGTAPYTFTILSGALPSGLTLSAGGTISGTTTTSGNYSFTVNATDSSGAPGPFSGSRSFTLTVNQPPAITSASSTTFTVGTAGSFTLTTTGFPAPTLSETGTLPGGVSFNASTKVLSGTPAVGSGGTYSVTFTATNGVTPDATQSFTLTVNEAPAITSASSTTFTVGTGGSFTVTATGFPAPTLTKTGTLPSGVSFNASTGVLSGTPAVGSGGNYTLTFTASNGVGGNATQSFVLTVNEAPGISSVNGTTFSEGTAGSFTVTTTGFPKPSLTETGALPTGVTFTDNGNGTATLAGTPAYGSHGSYGLTLTASNGIGGGATQAFTLTISLALSITSANATIFTVGSAGTFTVTTSGALPITLSKTGALPAGVTFTDNGNGTATLSGTPAAGSGGSYPLTFTAHNGVAPDATQTFTLTVNQPPAITSASSTTFTVGTAGSFTLTTTGFPAPTLSETGTLPGGVSFNASTKVLSGTPAVGSGGTYSVTFTATNGVTPDATQTFTLTVNEAPAITSSSSTTFTVATAGTFTVTTRGFPKPTLTKTGTLPSGVSFTDNGNGTATLSGTPAAGTGGNYSLTITASNGIGGNATQTFTLTVNQPPAITSANATTFSVGTGGSFTVTATGFPAPTLTKTGTLPSGVSFNASTGVLSGTPAANTQGTYPLTFTAANGVGSNATQAFTLTVSVPPPAAPSNLAVTSVFSTQVSLSWTDNSNNEDGFKVERKTGAGGTYALVATLAANTTAYTDTTVAAATTYYYRVKAFSNTLGSSGYSNEVSATTLTNNSVSFDGTNNTYFGVPNSSSINITGSITLEAWIKTTASVTEQGIAERYYTYSRYDGGYALRLENAKPRFYTVQNGKVFTYVEGPDVVNDGQWHHVAGIFTGSQLQIYVDGTLANSIASTQAPASGSLDIKIGGGMTMYAQNTWFNGLIDEVRLTAAVVYSSNFTPSHHLTALADTRGLWKFDGLSTLDSSGNANNGTLYGNATYSTDTP